MITVGSDFSGVGAFDQALQRLGINYETIFACDMDKYARQTYIENYGEPKYFPSNVYEREIPKNSLDIYMTSPPCQAFSLAGKRLGKNDKRGILFFNSLEFIQKNKPRYFIFENVKGLLSDDNGKTFSEWVNYLGGKSINGLPVLFPFKNSVPYHLYFKVLNAKQHGVPQNRERVFLIGIRDNSDNNFRFPIEEHLTKRLKDVLEEEVNEKYFLSEKLISGFVKHSEKHNEKGNGFKFEPHTIETKISNSITTKVGSRTTDPYFQIKSATLKGYEIETIHDSINLSVTNSKTRRGRVGKQVAQTLDTGCQQATIVGGKWNDFKNELGVKKGFEPIADECSPTLLARARNDGSGMAAVSDGFKIRRLTPRECFRLMDFPDSFNWTVSDSQAYKQAGNSIVVNVLFKIIKNFNL